VPRLEVRDISVLFGGLLALDRVSLEVPQGQIVGLIGPNGAGKTTLLNVISRFVDPLSGITRFDGHNLLTLPAHQIVRLGIGRTFQGADILPQLSVRDNVLVGLHGHHRRSVWAYALRVPGAAQEERELQLRADEILELLDLTSIATVPVSGLPFALRKRVDLARALAIGPRLLLLDEPAAGLVPEESRRLARRLRDIRHRYGCAMLLVEHDMSVVMDVCDHVVVLDFGRAIARGTPEEVRHDPAVIEAYLGEVAVAGTGGR